MMRSRCLPALLGLCLTLPALAQTALPGAGPDAPHFTPIDVFGLEYASDPQIAPDGETVVYVRSAMDIMKDRTRSSLWTIHTDGTGHRALTGGTGDGSPRWSPDGSRLLYASSDDDGRRQLFLRWMDTGQTTRLTDLTSAPSGIAWSPDGKWIAFTMQVDASSKPFASLPTKPEGAEWAAPPTYIDQLNYRADGAGYLDESYAQVFVLPAEGGTPRRLTSGPYDHGAPAWTPEGDALLVSANRREDAEYDPVNSELYEIRLEDSSITALTDRQGPDGNPVVSPDGRLVAYLGFDDRQQGYQITRLYVMNRDGTSPRALADTLDRDIDDAVWADDSRGLYVRFDDEGTTSLAYLPLDGAPRILADDLGGLSLGRPYSGSAFSVARDGRFAYTVSRPDRPADLAVGGSGDDAPRTITQLNEDLLAHKTLGEVEEIWYESSFDDRRIQGWIVKPPDFDPEKKYPLLLEIHGGPFSNYGDRFSAEIQLYAAAGYVVLYTNPRGSTSYGEAFGNLIHHNYPGEDYDDLMSGVDAVLTRGYVDEDNLYVTGGSGGGVLTAWIVGKTDRFRAAVVAKPVINWTSFALTSDGAAYYPRYWFPGAPWEEQAQYWARSPLSLVGNVTTPTMLLTGESDYRTPISETEQYYTALKLRKVDTAMVRIPGASHGIASRPSRLIAKVAYILAWFDRYGADAATSDAPQTSSSDSPR